MYNMHIIFIICIYHNYDNYMYIMCLVIYICIYIFIFEPILMYINFKCICYHLAFKMYVATYELGY